MRKFEGLLEIAEQLYYVQTQRIFRGVLTSRVEMNYDIRGAIASAFELEATQKK